MQPRSAFTVLRRLADSIEAADIKMSPVQVAPAGPVHFALHRRRNDAVG